MSPSITFAAIVQILTLFFLKRQIVWEYYEEYSFPLEPPEMLLVVVTVSISKQFLMCHTLQTFDSCSPHKQPMRWAVNVPGLHSSTWLGLGSDFSRVALEPRGNAGRDRKGSNCRGNSLSKSKTSLCMGDRKGDPLWRLYTSQRWMLTSLGTRHTVRDACFPSGLPLAGLLPGAATSTELALLSEQSRWS